MTTTVKPAKKQQEEQTEAPGLKITQKKCKGYMKQWLEFKGITFIRQDDDFLYFTARDYLNRKPRVEVKIECVSYGADWNVWERPLGDLDGWHEWQWIDAIPTKDEDEDED